MFIGRLPWPNRLVGYSNCTQKFGEGYAQTDLVRGRQRNSTHNRGFRGARLPFENNHVRCGQLFGGTVDLGSLSL